MFFRYTSNRLHSVRARFNATPFEIHCRAAKINSREEAEVPTRETLCAERHVPADSKPAQHRRHWLLVTSSLKLWTGTVRRQSAYSGAAQPGTGCHRGQLVIERCSRRHPRPFEGLSRYASYGLIWVWPMSFSGRSSRKTHENKISDLQRDIHPCGFHNYVRLGNLKAVHFGECMWSKGTLQKGRSCPAYFQWTRLTTHHAVNL